MNKNRVMMSAIRYDPHSRAYESVYGTYWYLINRGMPLPLAFIGDNRLAIIQAMEKYDYGQ
jgi:hypothetical protein